MPCGRDDVPHFNDPNPEPDWKRDLTPEQQRERAAAIGGYGWLAFVGLCVAAMSWNGLVGFAEHVLRLERPWSWVVPVALDGLAVTLAFLSLRSVLAGDPAGFPRVLAWVVVGMGAAFNYYQAALRFDDPAAETFFAAMTILVYLTFEVILRQLQRRNLRAAGAIEPPLPRFRFARWLPGVAMRETVQAWKIAVRYGVTDPSEALELVRSHDEDRTRERTRVHVELERPDRLSGETLTPVPAVREQDLQPDRRRTGLAIAESEASTVVRAKAVLVERPDIKGPELAELLGLGRSRGYELLRAARNGSAS